MKKAMIVSAVLGVVVLLVLSFVSSSGPDLSSYEHLREPRITTLPAQKMIEAIVTGDPSVAGNRAFSNLFSAYYKVIKSSANAGAAVPRARWPKEFTAPRSEWLGIYAIPIPDDVTRLPEKKGSLEVKIATWNYGEVAEILHVGPYGAEQPTIEKLLAFIAKAGYKIAGPHEEEYLRGPGLLSAGDPEKYYTIIRYQVKKTGK
ncbi:MAG: GyrI-like domain-containing protein [Nitrospirota bacterium]|nr:GyrI-like domain-containing protein [Nitrospirota bacterium]